MQFRNDIQGLRAIAFLMVLIFHMNAAWLPGGFLGVDLFFVISGFLMTQITLSDIDKGRFSFKQFYFKRIKRLVPAYLFLLIIVFIVSCGLLLYTDIPKFQKTLKSAVGFYSNYHFATGDSYFGAKLSENPLLHTWSLAVEMQFYLILPWIIFWGKKYLKFIYIVIILGLTAYSTYGILSLNHNSDMYFSVWARIPEFLVGGCFALFLKKGLDFGDWRNDMLAWLAFFLLLGCSFSITETAPFPGALALLPCLLGAVLLSVGESSFSKLMSSKPLVYIGELSYSLYLWHWPILAFFRYTTDSYELESIQLIYALLLTLVMSLLSYYAIEKALRYTSTKQLAMAGLPLLALFVVGVFNLPALTKSHKIDDLYSQPSFGITSHNRGKVQRLGERTKRDSILLIGDSHALMLKPFLDKVGKKYHFSFETTTNDGIPALPEVLEQEMLVSDINFYKNSRRLVGITSDLIKRNKVIILNSTSFVRYPSLMKTVENLCKNLESDQKLILVRSFPTLTKSPLRLNSGILKLTDEKIELHLKLDNKAFIEKLAKKYSNVYSYDIAKSRIFKTPGYINDTISYYNATHLNTYGSYKLADDIGEDFYHFIKHLE